MGFDFILPGEIPKNLDKYFSSQLFHGKISFVICVAKNDFVPQHGQVRVTTKIQASAESTMAAEDVKVREDLRPVYVFAGGVTLPSTYPYGFLKGIPMFESSFRGKVAPPSVHINDIPPLFLSEYLDHKINKTTEDHFAKVTGKYDDHDVRCWISHLNLEVPDVWEEIIGLELINEKMYVKLRNGELVTKKTMDVSEYSFRCSYELLTIDGERAIKIRICGSWNIVPLDWIEEAHQWSEKKAERNIPADIYVRILEQYEKYSPIAAHWKKFFEM